MEGIPFFRRRTRKKEKVENLYKILGTRSNISQERIKEKYIEKVREFPPETHPEEFEDIRRAYETLKDPKKRKQYDMMRKYGDKIEKTMEDVAFFMATGNFEKAKKLLEYASEIDPDNIPIKLTQAELFLDLEEFEQFHSIMNGILENSDADEKEFVIFIEFNMLSANGYEDRALDVLEQGKKYITDMRQYHKLRVNALVDSGQFNQAWYEFKDALPNTEELEMDDLGILISWLNTAIALERWEEIPRIQNQIRKLSKTIIDEEELSIVKNILLNEAESFVEIARYRPADIFMQIVVKIDPKDTHIRKRRDEIQTAVKLDTELFRAANDRELFPYVHTKMLDLYLSRYASDRIYEEFLEGYPHDMMREAEWMKEEIAYGVLRVKKKYPSLYREFNKELGELFNQSTEGLNREQRRRLK